MNLIDTVSVILSHDVTEKAAKDFAKDQFGVLATYLRENNPKYPNGFESWKETFFQFTTQIQYKMDKDKTHINTIIKQKQDSDGCMGLCSLAEEWADKFELENKGVEWDGEYFDAIDKFVIINNKIKQ